MATPIGNLGDITLRALDALRFADILACEDTRTTRRLLAAFDIEAAGRLRSYHEHSPPAAREGLVAAMAGGRAVALVSEAGTPAISDPGYKLVRAAIAAGQAVFAVPGPSAAIAGASIAGLPTDRILFAGFLPSKAHARRRALAELATLKATLVFFESARRLAASLADMAAVLGPREAAIAREMTKFHEQVTRARLDGLARDVAASGPPKGEVVVVVGPPEDRPVDDAALDAALSAALRAGSLRAAVDDVSRATGRPRREVYARALALRDAP